MRRVAVVGGGLGGMTAAGLLARAGCAVTLFDTGQQLGGKARAVELDGLRLDTGPTLLTLPEVVEGLFRALGAAELCPRFIELNPHCTYFYPDGCTFTASPDLEATAASAAELRPSERNGVRSFYAHAAEIHRAAGEPYLEAPFEGFASFMARVLRRGPRAVAAGLGLGTLAELGERHFRTAHLRQFVGRFATYAGASPYQASAAFALIAHLERARGVHHVVGGVGALVDALGAALARLGVEVRLGQAAQWTRQGTEYRVGPEGDQARFDALVVNADPLAALGRQREPLALSGYVLLLEVDRRVRVPHHAVLFSHDYRGELDALFDGRMPDDPTLYLCHPAATDPTMAPPDKSGLFAMLNAPALPGDQRERWEGWAPRLREQVLGRLAATFPELASARVRVLAERTPVDLARLGAPGGSIYGFLPHGRLGPFRRPRIRGRTPGLFYSGGGTHPGGGVPLVMLSGRFAASMALEYLGRAAP